MLGLEDMAHTVSTMSPLNLMISRPVKPLVTRQGLPSHFHVSATTFFENKYGRF